MMDATECKQRIKSVAAIYASLAKRTCVVCDRSLSVGGRDSKEEPPKTIAVNADHAVRRDEDRAPVARRRRRRVAKF